jgi:hypothetical protein
VEPAPGAGQLGERERLARRVGGSGVRDVAGG